MKETGCSVYKKKEAEHYLKQSYLVLLYKTRCRVISLIICFVDPDHCVRRVNQDM